MDLSEWLAAEDPVAILVLLWDSGRGTDRKFTLFAVAYCRLEGPVDERTRRGVEMLERFAEGLATAEELAASHGSAWRAYDFFEELLVRRADPYAHVDEWRLATLFRCVFGDPR